MARLVIVNPSERGDHQRYRPYNRTRRYVLSFGAIGTTHLMVWGRGIEDALESAADWLADNAPGHIMTHDSEELQELFNEAMQELYPHAESIDDLDESEVSACQEKATADLTYTEAGYLTSYEWFITLDEHATREDVIAFVRDLDERNYGDEPTVAVAK